MKTRLGVRSTSYPWPLPQNACLANCDECGSYCVVRHDKVPGSTRALPRDGVICVECFIAVVAELKQAALDYAADPLPETQRIRDAIVSTLFGRRA